MVKNIWPEHSLENLERIMEDYINSNESSGFVAIEDGKVIGMAVYALRHDYVEGCDHSPVGYLEGIFVEEKYRNKGYAKSLCGECEAWAKENGCKEFASDCELINTTSLKFHLSIGFEEANRIICFKKEL